MKRVLIAVVAAAAAASLATPAAAQDANGSSGWGCFVGAHFAERWDTTKFTRTKTVLTLGTPAGPSAVSAFGSQSPNAAGYGAQLGCDWHNGPWVFGAQLQHDNGVAGTNVVTAFPANTIRASAISLETITGRAGYEVAPDLLAYVRTGFAVAFNNYNITTTVGPLLEQASTRNVGFVIGGGLEYSITREWSVYGEFTNQSFGSVPVTFVSLPPNTVATPGDVIRIRQSINQLMIGVNFHF